MKFVPRVLDNMNVIHEVESNQTDNSDVSAIKIPMHELELFADGLLRENRTHAGSASPRMNAMSAAQKILRVRKDIVAILALRGLPLSPTFDIILDLFTSEGCGRKVTVTDAGIAGHCSPTTGLRWISTLADAGIVQKANDPLDHRRTVISLTDDGRELTLDCIQVYLNDETNG